MTDASLDDVIIAEVAANFPKEYKKIAWAKEGVDIENDFAPLYASIQIKKQRLPNSKS